MAALDKLKDFNELMIKIGIAEKNNTNVIFHGADLVGADLNDVDLRGADLTGANLTGANLTGANLIGAKLEGVHLEGANLTDAELMKAKLKDADLTGANLTRANLKEADLRQVYLIGANLTQANLTQAIFTSADLMSANLTRADLTRAILKRAELIEADLTGANLTRADLTGAVLTGAILNDAILIRAVLKGADFTQAKLIRANLMEANLKEADLTLANLTQANLTLCNLTDANFTRSVMMLTNLTGAILRGAENVNLTDVIIYSTQNPAPVDSHQVHKAASKINYKEINKLLESITKTESIPQNIDYPTFIKDKITGFIANFDESSKEKLMGGLNAIIEQRLKGLDYKTLSKDVRDSIFYALNYVSSQPADFQKMYAETFIQDCVQAYDGPNGMTCALGGIERILFSLVPACAESATDDCEKIVSIIEANPEKLVKEYIFEWYKLHSKNKFLPEDSEIVRRQNLIEFLKEKLPIMKPDWIESKVKEIADNLGYEDGDFAYGGGRKKRRTKKRQTKRTRQTKRKRRTKHTKRR